MLRGLTGEVFRNFSPLPVLLYIVYWQIIGRTHICLEVGKALVPSGTRAFHHLKFRLKLFIITHAWKRSFKTGPFISAAGWGVTVVSARCNLCK